jgi:hypothetical protein
MAMAKACQNVRIEQPGSSSAQVEPVGYGMHVRVDTVITRYLPRHILYGMKSTLLGGNLRPQEQRQFVPESRPTHAITRARPGPEASNAKLNNPSGSSSPHTLVPTGMFRSVDVKKACAHLLCFIPKQARRRNASRRCLCKPHDRHFGRKLVPTTYVVDE